MTLHPALILIALVASPIAADREAALVSLARAAVEAEVRGQAPTAPSGKSSPVPVFVTIEKQGQVVGCRGALECRSSTLEEEVARSARSAAAHDPRYRPLRPDDLRELAVTVTLVRRLEPVEGVEGLSPADGLVLKAGGKVGVVLPWEGKDPQIRLRWAYRKAGVPQGAPCRLYRLVADRFRG